MDQERGGIGDREVENTPERIKTFFQKHAETRFCKIDSCWQLGYAPSSPAGYVWEEDNGERIFLVEPNVFRDELCREVNRQILRENLKELGWLTRNRYGMLMETKWIGGQNKRGICSFLRGGKRVSLVCFQLQEAECNESSGKLW